MAIPLIPTVSIIAKIIRFLLLDQSILDESKLRNPAEAIAPYAQKLVPAKQNSRLDEFLNG